MRFIHMADIHFDSDFSSLAGIPELCDTRRLEQRESFKKIIEYIKKENIKFLFIAGDLYEQKYIREETIIYINNLFKDIPNTNIFISPGNHDPLIKNSFYSTFNWNKNVYIFNSEINKLEFDNVNIYGFGFNDFYCEDSGIENIKLDQSQKLNILIAHADLNASKVLEKSYNPIAINQLNNIGFDYCALGHIHKSRINISDRIIYPGSTISFGFDELGEHGILDVTLDKNNCDINFIKFDDRIFEELNFNISDIFSFEELIEKINELKLEENKMYKLILIGDRNFEINLLKIKKFIKLKNIIKLKDYSKTKYDLKEISSQNNLKGVFVKEMLSKIDDSTYSKEDIEKAIEIGLDVL